MSRSVEQDIDELFGRVVDLERTPPATGGGIEFDTYPQAGGFLFAEVTGGTAYPGGYGLELRDSGGAGIGITTTGSINTHSDSSTSIFSDDTISVQSVEDMVLETTGFGDVLIQTTGSGGISLTSIAAVFVSGTSISIDSAVVLMPSLPTSAPAGAGKVWNDTGTLKIT